MGDFFMPWWRVVAVLLLVAVVQCGASFDDGRASGGVASGAAAGLADGQDPDVDKAITQQKEVELPEGLLNPEDDDEEEAPAGPAKKKLNVQKIAVISDVHGDAFRLRSALQLTGMVTFDADIEDKKYDSPSPAAFLQPTWVGGDNYLVFTGDLIDKYNQDEMVMRTVMALKRAAPNQVVLLMGNHETMLLMGDYHDAISEVPSQSPRQADKTFADPADEFAFVFNEPKDSFYGESDGKTPANYWNTVARWPAVVRIGNLLFAHGGIHEDYADFKAFNRRVRTFLLDSDKAVRGKTLTREDRIQAHVSRQIELGITPPSAYQGDASDEADQQEWSELFNDKDQEHTGSSNTPFWDRNWTWQAAFGDAIGAGYRANPCKKLLTMFEKVEASAGRDASAAQQLVMVLGHTTTSIENVPFGGCSCWADGVNRCTASPSPSTGPFNEGKQGNAHIWAVDAALSRSNYFISPRQLAKDPRYWVYVAVKSYPDLVLIFEADKATSVAGGAGNTGDMKRDPFVVPYEWPLFQPDSVPEF